MDEDNIGPSPYETDAMAWEEINAISQKKICIGSKNLASFIRNTGYLYITEKGDDKTNIIDQGTPQTYYFNKDIIMQLFMYLDNCRLEKSIIHFSERQYSTFEVHHSGIMIDFDIKTTIKKPIILEKHYFKISHAIIRTLCADLDFAGADAGLGRRPLSNNSNSNNSNNSNYQETEFKTVIAFTIKEETVCLTQQVNSAAAGQDRLDRGTNSTNSAAAGQDRLDRLYKYGFHILLPGFKVKKAYKRILFQKLKNDPSINSVLKELGATGDITECLDQNSASVPVLFLGSCKRGSIPYKIGSMMEVIIDPTSLDCPPMIKKLTDQELVGYNLVAELALIDESEYSPPRQPLIKKYIFSCNQDIEDEINKMENAKVSVENNEVLIIEHSLSTLTLHNAEARHIHALLDLLEPVYYTERNRWRDVIFALANTNEQYKPLAIWFSRKSEAQWNNGGLEALEVLWDEAILSKNSKENPLTMRSIIHWAKLSNPEMFSIVMNRSYFTILSRYVYEHEGRLQHYMIAKILQLMIGKKFCVDVDPYAKNSYCWFEFVIPGQTMKPGETWKWRREVEPDDVHIYISEKLTQVMDKINEHIEEQKTKSGDENYAKYYVKLQKNFIMSKNSLYNDTFKHGVIKQANFLFRNRGFIEQLDTVPFLFGVSNGVLKLGPKCSLINYFHEYPISRYTTIVWKPFDENDTWTRLVLNAIEDIIPEPDARDWILYHAAQGLSSESKEGLLLLWEGGGQNGKTSFLRWVAKALGPYADKFNIQLMCCDREDADKPNSAMMKFKYLNWAYAEESNRSQSLNVARMKEMVNAGEVSGRDLNSKQETFTMKSNFVAASQYSFIVDTTDHGTWRRLRHYTSKTKFRKDPDPTNIFEKKEDQRFVRQYPNEPQFLSSVLSILTHYYERLQVEHNGELKNVKCATIECETELFRVSQDALHRWICENIVISPNNEKDYTTSELGSLYSDWYNKTFVKKIHVPAEVIKEIESSAISKYLKPAPNRILLLRGCRILTADERGLRDGEELISERETTYTSMENKKIENWWR